VKTTRDSKFKNIVGDRVRLARVAMNPRVSQDDLAGRLARLGVQVNQAVISKIESRSRIVMDYEAKALAKALKVSIAWLYGENVNG
jgi:ribosome-binding protein aMBF1 (putative translation factor)